MHKGMIMDYKVFRDDSNRVFSEENASSISNSLKNFESATNNLNRLTQNLNKPVDNISNAASSTDLPEKLSFLMILR